MFAPGNSRTGGSGPTHSPKTLTSPESASAGSSSSGVARPASSPFMEFVVTEASSPTSLSATGAPPGLVREGHSVVVEGFVRPLEDPDKERRRRGPRRPGDRPLLVRHRGLAKHDEKYMPAEVAKAIDANKKKIAAAAASAAEAQDEERERNQRS
ncbi:hypothetical protein Scep_013230 [Stephania cephalantha]|uniref:Uncharacterized protein n=1 Tax=Stephania cephalantha TaxID=152367 RepID=A0AAP0P777_9MAGN